MATIPWSPSAAVPARLFQGYGPGRGTDCEVSVLRTDLVVVLPCCPLERRAVGTQAESSSLVPLGSGGRNRGEGAGPWMQEFVLPLALEDPWSSGTLGDHSGDGGGAVREAIATRTLHPAGEPGSL